MNEQWWEGFIRLVCDFWWLLLLLIVLLLTAYFTRALWLPILGF